MRSKTVRLTSLRLAPPSETSRRVGQRIRALRDAQHVSRRELAAAIGVTKRTVERIEGGESIALKYLEPTARRLGVTVDELLGLPSSEGAADSPELLALRAIVSEQAARDPKFPGLVLRLVNALLDK